MSSSRVWINSSLPQTLYIAHLLMYIQGGLDLLFALAAGYGFVGGLSTLIWMFVWILTAPGKVVAAFGIANRQYWGYLLGVVASVIPLCLRTLQVILTADLRWLVADPITLMFTIALLALLLHKQSRDYVSDWRR